MTWSQPESTTPGEPLALAEVIDRCASPWGLQDYSPLGVHHYLLLDTAGKGRDSSQLAAVAERLRGLPCPVIAVAGDPGEALSRGIDVVAASEREALSLARNIDAQPLAAMTLVQLLRHNETATPEQGLADVKIEADAQVGDVYTGLKLTTEGLEVLADRARVIVEEGLVVVVPVAAGSRPPR